MFVCLLFVCLLVYLFICLFVYLKPVDPVLKGRMCRKFWKKLLTEVLGWDPVEDWISSRASKMHSTLLKLHILPTLWISAPYLQKWPRYRRFLVTPQARVTDVELNTTKGTSFNKHVPAIWTIQWGFSSPWLPARYTTPPPFILESTDNLKHIDRNLY